MLNRIAELVKKLWNVWNKRGVILLSLSLQTVLVLFVPFRKTTGHKLIMLITWSAYLLADWAANFGIALITQRARDTSERSMPTEEELLAFWASFLLLHVGGPDTITAFALEDNELLTKQLLGLVVQVVAAVYIFFQPLRGNKLLFPTVLVFIAALIKYFERIRALDLASLEKFRDLSGDHFSRLLGFSHENGRVIPIQEDRDYVEVGCQYFNDFRLILADLVPSFKEVKLEGPSIDDFSPADALGIIEVELNLVYEVFHTKIQATHCVLGIVLRFISFGSVLAALSIFYFRVEKHGFNEFDVRVTYTLFGGAIALDIINFFMLVSSDWTFVALQNGADGSILGKFKNRIAAFIRPFFILKSPRCQHWHVGDKYKVLAIHSLFGRWSGSVSIISWTAFWLNVPPSRVNRGEIGLYLAWQKVIHYLGIDRLIPWMAIAKNNVTRFLHMSKIIDDVRIQRCLSHQPLTEELWQFIFYEIKRKAQYAGDPEAGVKRTVCPASGHCTLQDLGTNGDHLIEIMKKISKNYAYFSINVTVPVWHLATELLYNTAEEVSNEQTNNARQFSKILSDYMLYLLLLKPTMMNSAPICTKRILRQTNSAADELLEKKGIKSRPVKDACKKIMDDPVPELSDSALQDAIKLANGLQKLDEDKKWETVSKIWVEILSYGASHCLPMAHAQHVTRGGELITFVWLLMHHFHLVEPKD